eukprot:3931136-Alexandrium_andersonii.AAC.1
MCIRDSSQFRRFNGCSERSPASKHCQERERVKSVGAGGFTAEGLQCFKRFKQVPAVPICFERFLPPGKVPLAPGAGGTFRAG